MTIAAKDGLWFMTARVNVLLAAADNADGLSILEHRMARDFGPPYHVHHREDETFHILEGCFRFDRDGAVSEAGPGSTVYIPAGVRHGFRILSPEGGRCLTFTHGGFETAVRQASRPATGGGLPAQLPPTPAEQEALARICAANGIDLLGPPIA